MRRARDVQLTFTYDAYGYRNPRTVPRADVVLIGDSYVEGFNANDDEVVARKLEERLGRPVESMGVSGYGTLQNLIVLDKDAPKLDPKVAVFFFFEGNDLYDDFRIEETWNYWDPDYSSSSLGMAKFHTWKQRSFVRNFLGYAMRWLDPIVPNHAPYAAPIASGPRKGETVLFASYAAIPWSEWIDGALENCRRCDGEGGRDRAAARHQDSVRFPADQGAGLLALRDAARQLADEGLDLLADPRALRSVLPRRERALPRPHRAVPEGFGGRQHAVLADRHPLVCARPCVGGGAFGSDDPADAGARGAVTPR